MSEHAPTRDGHDLIRVPDAPEGVPTAAASESLRAALYEMKRVIVGQDDLLERILVALLADGHVLIEGLPGLAKTLTVRTLADVMGGRFSRVQFTPDLVPSDLLGTRVWRPTSERFDVELGPVFCDFLLADEINRAPAKVQSALLEVMQERQVTIGGQTFRLEDPFLVLATQNPIESEGTYPLPEAQVDRFLLKVIVRYPAGAEEVEIVRRSLAEPASLRSVLTIEELLELRRASAGAYIDREVIDYAVALILATRDPVSAGLPDLAPWIAFGASPRGSIGLVHAARALATLRGRGYVMGEDVRDVAKDVLRHRLVLTYDGLAEDVEPDGILDAILEKIPVPAARPADGAFA
jgi:MoxR-like ATPase